MTIKQLREEATGWLIERGYTESTIYVNYVRFWNGFEKSMDKSTVYLKEAADDYVTQKYGWDIMKENPSLLPLNESRIYRAFRALYDFYTSHNILGTSMAGSSVRQTLPTHENFILESYMVYIGGLDYSTNSKRLTYGTIHHYLSHCPISDINDNHVLRYFKTLSGHAKATIKKRLNILKQFHLYCVEHGFLGTDYSPLFPSTKTRRNTEIPSVYTPEEISILFDYLRNNKKNRKRNYAIALLAAVYGFRSGDLVKMRLANFDWDNKTIHIDQSKTANTIEHKLIVQTWDALVDYIFNERSDNTVPYIFLKQDGCALSSTSVSSMIFNAFIHSGIIINGRKHGSHSLRHSLASNMLASDAGMLDISKALGHASVDTTRIYSKIDVVHLRMCGLEVPVNAR